jgi:hypothetical protein
MCKTLLYREQCLLYCKQSPLKVYYCYAFDRSYATLLLYTDSLFRFNSHLLNILLLLLLLLIFLAQHKLHFILKAMLCPILFIVKYFYSIRTYPLTLSTIKLELFRINLV